MEPNRLDAAAMATSVRTGELSPVELVASSFARIDEAEPEINAFCALFRDEAGRAAREAERAVRDGEELGPLHGVPIAIKESMWMRGVPATDGSRALESFVPPEEAVLVARLRAAGAIVVGRTNVPEFCYAGYTDNDLFGLTRNPHGLDRTPGGSSGGSGAAVAYGAVPIALGTDAGGSIRIPAAFCGVAGHKPTFGLVPQGPGFPSWRTFNSCGPLAGTVRDLALCLGVIAGPHPSDETCVPAPTPGGYLEATTELDLGALRVAYSEDLGHAPLEPAVRTAFRAAIERLRAAGWQLEKAHPGTPDPTDLWTRASLPECYAAERGFLEQQEYKLRPLSIAVIRLGERHAPGYAEAQIERGRYVRRWAEFLSEYDLLLTPTMQMPAFPVGIDRPTEIDGRPVDPELDEWCAFVLPGNLTGQPALSVQCGVDPDGLPVGLQIMGARLRDADVLAAGAAWEALAEGLSYNHLHE